VNAPSCAAPPASPAPLRVLSSPGAPAAACPAPTYSLRPASAPPAEYPRAVARLADEVVAAGEALRPIVEAYGQFVEESGREARRSHEEYLLEALTLGVLWRARGDEATRMTGARRDLMDRLARARRTGMARRRDGSNGLLLSLDRPFEPGRLDPTLVDVERLLTWLVASGECDGEAARLEGWEAFLAADRASARETLTEIVIFAAAFEGWGVHALGRFTAGVDRFLGSALPNRRWREDAVQCARRRTEYHLAMVGAELLNRAWRGAFLACRRHVVVLPGCMRRRPEAACAAERTGTDLRCTSCASGCAVQTAIEVARRAGGEAVAVAHGSDLARFLRSAALAGGDVGIVGVACVPGLLGAGWSARASGLAAQCVLLEASGCEHWREKATPTAIDLGELRRILRREV